MRKIVLVILDIFVVVLKMMIDILIHERTQVSLEFYTPGTSIIKVTFQTRMVEYKMALKQC